jgi:hypothetical protein
LQIWQNGCSDFTKGMNNPTILTRPDLMAASYRELPLNCWNKNLEHGSTWSGKVVGDLALHMCGLGVQ